MIIFKYAFLSDTIKAPVYYTCIGKIVYAVVVYKVAKVLHVTNRYCTIFIKCEANTALYRVYELRNFARTCHESSKSRFEKFVIASPLSNSSWIFV